MALVYLNSASAAEPNNEEILLYLASTYDKLGRKEDVLEMLEAIHKIDSKNLKIKKWLADTYYEKNEFAKAEKLYQQSLAENMTNICKCGWQKYRPGRKNTARR